MTATPVRFLSALMLLIFVCSAGCVRREGSNSDCKWPEEPDAKALNPNQRAYARHLREDVEFVEDLAIRYMDAHLGLRSGEFNSQQTASQAMNTCLRTLLQQIGTSHDIPVKKIAKFFGRRSLAIDAAVILPFILVCTFLAGLLAAGLRRRYPPEDGWTAALTMIILSSLAFGIGGTLLGEVWSSTAESIRVGTGHLSYRVDRLP